jgi:hypothetical protein
MGLGINYCGDKEKFFDKVLLPIIEPLTQQKFMNYLNVKGGGCLFSGLYNFWIKLMNKNDISITIDIINLVNKFFDKSYIEKIFEENKNKIKDNDTFIYLISNITNNGIIKNIDDTIQDLIDNNKLVCTKKNLLWAIVKKMPKYLNFLVTQKNIEFDDYLLHLYIKNFNGFYDNGKSYFDNSLCKYVQFNMDHFNTSIKYKNKDAAKFILNKENIPKNVNMFCSDNFSKVIESEFIEIINLFIENKASYDITCLRNYYKNKTYNEYSSNRKEINSIKIRNYLIENIDYDIESEMTKNYLKLASNYCDFETLNFILNKINVNDDILNLCVNCLLEKEENEYYYQYQRHPDDFIKILELFQKLNYKLYNNQFTQIYNHVIKCSYNDFDKIFKNFKFNADKFNKALEYPKYKIINFLIEKNTPFDYSCLEKFYNNVPTNDKLKKYIVDNFPYDMDQEITEKYFYLACQNLDIEIINVMLNNKIFLDDSVWNTCISLFLNIKKKHLKENKEKINSILILFRKFNYRLSEEQIKKFENQKFQLDEILKIKCEQKNEKKKSNNEEKNDDDKSIFNKNFCNYKLQLIKCGSRFNYNYDIKKKDFLNAKKLIEGKKLYPDLEYFDLFNYDHNYKYDNNLDLWELLSYHYNKNNKKVE